MEYLETVYKVYNLKQEIYWMCDELRRLDQFGLSKSEKFKQLQEKVLQKQKQYNEAEKRFDDFIETCSLSFYMEPLKKS